MARHVAATGNRHAEREPDKREAGCHRQHRVPKIKK
jgi:hypothetical protein